MNHDPGNEIGFAAAGGMFDEITFACAELADVGDDFVDDIELMIAREDEF